jgi:hypothetical protein
VLFVGAVPAVVEKGSTLMLPRTKNIPMNPAHTAALLQRSPVISSIHVQARFLVVLHR